MDELKRLQELRLKLAGEIRAKSDEFNKTKAWKDDAEKQAWEKLNADYDATLKAIEVETAKRAEATAVESRLKAIEEYERESLNARGTIPGLEDTAGRKPIGSDDGVINEETRALALAGWMAGQMGRRQTDRHLAAMARCNLKPWQTELVLDTAPTYYLRSLQRQFRSVGYGAAVDHCLRSAAPELRALSAYSSAAGGFAVGETFLRTLEVNMLAFGGMRQVAETISTTTGERMTWPTADDTTNTGVQLGESLSIGSSVDPSFAAVIWEAYKFSSQPVLVPYELLEDAFIDLPTLLGELLGTRLGRVTNTKYTTGTGANTPKGVITAAATFSAASATAITFDDIFGLIHSVDPAYRAVADGFMLNDQIILAVRKLKDGTGAYLWQPGNQAGVPDRLAGYPLTLNQDMDSTIASGKKTILFGKLSAYKIRRVNQIRMYRLQERYRDTDQDGFIALLREDGNLLTAGTSPVKVLLH